MYGSIWGAHRIGKPLPWDNDVDIGFDGEGIFADMTLDEFLAPFVAAGFKASNKWIQKGTMKFTKRVCGCLSICLHSTIMEVL